MPGVLVLLLLALPFVELAAFIQVAGWIGLLPALAGIVLVGLAGTWVVKREGTGVWRRAQARVRAGEVPTDELLNGLLLLVAGVLLLVPGFVTDVVAIVLLLPPVRAAVRAVLMRRLGRRVAVVVPGAGTVTRRVRTGSATYGPGTVTDVREVPPVAGGPAPSWPGRGGDGSRGRS